MSKTSRRISQAAGVAAALALLATGAQADPAPHSKANVLTEQAPGFASLNGGTTGGAGASAESIYTVSNRQQLLDALDNHGQRDAAKIIYVSGTIHGNEAADGTLLGEQDYAPGYDVAKYLSCFGEDGTWSDQRFDYCGEQRRARVNGSNGLKRQIEISIPSNTTLIGLGDDAGFDQTNLMFHLAKNVVVRNLSIEAPVDYFSSWDPWDGEEGAWNARFDAMSAVTSSNLWVDHVTLTDGRYLDRDAPTGPNGAPMNRHDGLFDMKDGTDFVTLSNSHLLNHDKTMLLGSGDDNADTDAGTLHVSIIGNFFEGIQERAPRVRYGQVHVANNYFLGRVNDPSSPVVSTNAGGYHYFLGLGYQSQVFSERNAFDYTGPGADETVAVYNWNANNFHDEGSWFKNKRVDLDSIAAQQYEQRVAEAEATGEPLPDWASAGFTPAVDWAPSYAFTPLNKASDVKHHAKTATGAGVLDIR